MHAVQSKTGIVNDFNLSTLTIPRAEIILLLSSIISFKKMLKPNIKNNTNYNEEIFFKKTSNSLYV